MACVAVQLGVCSVGLWDSGCGAVGVRVRGCGSQGPGLWESERRAVGVRVWGCGSQGAGLWPGVRVWGCGSQCVVCRAGGLAVWLVGLFKSNTREERREKTRLF